MISNLRQVLDAAPQSAVGSFNTLDIDMAAAVIGAAEDLDAPVVLGIATRHYHSVRGDALAAACRRLMQQAKVPVALHLDHAGAEDRDLVRAALDAGFTSIMVDGSHLEFDRLVLHGATGVPDQVIRDCVHAGIRKINYFSALLRTAMDTVRRNGSRIDNDFLDLKQQLSLAWREEIRHQIALFGLRNEQQSSDAGVVG